MSSQESIVSIISNDLALSVIPELCSSMYDHGVKHTLTSAYGSPIMSLSTNHAIMFLSLLTVGCGYRVPLVSHHYPLYFLLLLVTITPKLMVKALTQLASSQSKLQAVLNGLRLRQFVWEQFKNFHLRVFQLILRGELSRATEGTRVGVK